MVRRGGFEPPHPKAQRPQRCVSTVPPPAHIETGGELSSCYLEVIILKMGLHIVLSKR